MVDLSLICPMYKVSEYLPDLIESLIEGANALEVEILFVDDCCPESSGDVCEQLLNDLSGQIQFRWQLLRLAQNYGSGWARNQAMEIASGSYIGFIDSDDVVRPSYWQCIRKTIEEANYPEIIEFGYSEFTGDKKNCVNSVRQLPRQGNFQPFYTGFFSWSRVYRLDLVKNIKFSNGKYEDIAFVSISFINARRVCVIDSALIGYRKRAGSVTAHRDSSYVSILNNLVNSYANHYHRIESFERCRLLMFNKIFLILLKGARISDRAERQSFFLKSRDAVSRANSIFFASGTIGLVRRSLLALTLRLGCRF